MKKNIKRFGRTVIFHFAVWRLVTMLLIGFPACAHAIQPWSDGIKSVIDRLQEIDMALFLIDTESVSETLTSLDLVRIEHDKAVLLAEQGTLKQMLQLSSEIQTNTLANYAIPPQSIASPPSNKDVKP